jgi:nitrite reductase (NADH) large subunit
VVIDDHLGIAEELERQMQAQVDSYECEWARVVNDPAQQERFRHFANSEEPDGALAFVEERGQRRPADWVKRPIWRPARGFRIPSSASPHSRRSSRRGRCS